MKQKEAWMFAVSGAAAGVIAGLFGAGGGLVLIPLLRALTSVDNRELFPLSVSVMLPICLVSIAATAASSQLPWKEALPFLLGSSVGGMLAGIWGEKIPVIWLHRSLGILILWGGVRYLW